MLDQAADGRRRKPAGILPSNATVLPRTRRVERYRLDKSRQPPPRVPVATPPMWRRLSKKVWGNDPDGEGSATIYQCPVGARIWGIHELYRLVAVAIAAGESVYRSPSAPLRCLASGWRSLPGSL